MEQVNLVVGKQGTKPVILTLVERKTRKSLYVLVKNKTKKAVVAAIKRARKRAGGGDFDEVFKSITADNGSEFLDCEALKKAAKCAEVYRSYLLTIIMERMKKGQMSSLKTMQVLGKQYLLLALNQWKN